MRTRSLQAVAAAILALGAAAPAWAQMPANMPPLPVTTVAVKAQTVPVFKEYVGATRSVRAIDIRARVNGYLIQRAFVEGSDVKEGDLLYQIDPRDYKAQVDRYRAQVQSDQAAITYAQQDQQRTEKLASNDFATKASLDKTRSTLAQSQAQIELDRAQLRAAELNLGYTTIRAPFAGRMGKTQLDVGGLVSADTVLDTLVQLDPIYASFSPSEADWTEIAKLRTPGTVIEADLLLQGATEPTLHGKLDFVDNSVDSSSGTISMRAVFANPQKVLLPGQFVRVRLHLTDRPNTVLVPQVAIATSQVGQSVFVVGAGNKLEVRPLKLGATVRAEQIVEDGLKPGDRVVVDQLQKLQPGMMVDPKPAQS